MGVFGKKEIQKQFSGENREEKTVLLDQDIQEEIPKTELLEDIEVIEKNDVEKTVLLEETVVEERETEEEKEESTERYHTSTDTTVHITENKNAGKIHRCLNCMKEYDTEKADICPHCGFQIGTPPKELYHLYPGMELSGRYLIGTVLGFGGFGVTYRAWDQKLNCVAAVKEYYPAGIVNRIPGEKEVILYSGKGKEEFQKGLDRFLLEARNTVRFNSHPNIVHVFDFFEENRTAYMVMELLEGISLRTFVKNEGGSLPYQKVTEISLAVMDALSEIHKTGILHRDISPDNIFLCNNGTVKVLDFGAARFSKGQEDQERALTIMLKIGYAPPEQYHSKGNQGPWTDVYALGATMYRLITGIMPEESTDRAKNDHLRPIRALVEDVPAYLDHAIMKAMAIEIDMRFQTVEQFKKAILQKIHVEELKKERKKRRVRRIRNVFTVAAVICAFFGVGFWEYQKKQNETNLTETKLSVWLSLEEGEEETEKQQIYQEMAEEFQRMYPYVEIEFFCFPETVYEETLQKAMEAKEEMPSLFESSHITQNEDWMTDSTSVLEMLDLSEYYVLENDLDMSKAHLKIPLGMNVAVVYRNDIADTKQDVADITNLQDEVGQNGGLESFLNQEISFCVSDTSHFYQIQEALSGLYSIESVPDTGYFGTPEVFFSVNKKVSTEEQTAALRLLYYFLSQSSQDILHLQNEGEIPLLKEVFDEFVQVNQELEFLTDEITGMNWVEIEEFERKKEETYQKILLSEENEKIRK
ncbi:MAG: serine/threonine-protein kinase [bacterium]|nr:serine/threonine-protein kinase [bacterium]